MVSKFGLTVLLVAAMAVAVDLIVVPNLKSSSVIKTDRTNYAVGDEILFQATHISPSTAYYYGVLIPQGSGFQYLVITPAASSDPNGNLSGSFYLGSNASGATYFFVANAQEFDAGTLPCSFPSNCPPDSSTTPISVS